MVKENEHHEDTAVELIENRNFLFNEDVLNFFLTSCDKYDRYFLTFTMAFQYIVKRGLTISDLDRLKDILPYKSRIYLRSLYRLEAMNFIYIQAGGRTKEYKLSINGTAAMQMLKKAYPTDIDKTRDEIIEIIESMF